MAQTNKAVARANSRLRDINRRFGLTIALCTIETSENHAEWLESQIDAYETQYAHAIKGENVPHAWAA